MSNDSRYLLPPLVSPAGTPLTTRSVDDDSGIRVALDLTTVAFERVTAGIRVYGTWYGPRRRPCLALVPAHGIVSHERTEPCVVHVDDAWLWETDGAYAARWSMIFAASLRLNPADIRDCIRVTSAVRDNMQDLLTIPPKPPVPQRAVAEIVRTDAAGRESYTELTDDA
jgi:hypothetical protein